MDSFDGGAFAVGLAACAGGLVVLLGVTFALALKLGKHSVVDVAWGLGFVTVALISFGMSDGSGDGDRRLLITGMVVVWGARLAWHIGRRNAGHGEDPRYEALLAKADSGKRNSYALRMIYSLQGLLILFISLPVQVGQYASDDVGVLAAIGFVVWAVGLFFEALGDWQLNQFKADPANKGTVMDRGLWRYTRHPNYFGDACVWWGIWLVAAETGIGVFTILSPIVMTLFLTKGSGAALTEKRMAGRPGFDDYVARTSGFLPLPPKRR
ncbi:MAG TPA: DUF1295 domain-containing protein [Sporichthya sp.]|nr:DUF1295 domain-containing protein [Sporichthya sp.]